jgi:hypothetical protein
MKYIVTVYISETDLTIIYFLLVLLYVPEYLYYFCPFRIALNC